MSAVPYIVTRKTPSGYKGTVVLNGERRWTRERTCPYQLADALRVCYPGIDHVITEWGEVLDTDCLTLGECIEASAF